MTLAVAGYRTDARNFIERPQGAPRFQNVDRYRLQGFETEAVFHGIRGVLVRGRYAFLDAEDRTEGQEGTPLQYRPRHMVSAELRAFTRWGLEASTTFRYVAGQVYETRRQPLVQAGLPNYAVVGLRLSQRFGRTPLALFAGTDNLFDSAYEQSYGFPQAGRIIYLGFDLRS